METTPLTNRLRDLASHDRPQERLQKLGPGALSDVELLAMLLRSGTRGHDVISLCTHLMAESGSLAALIGWSPSDYQRIKGIGRIKALQLITVMEIARRVLSQRGGEAPLLDTPAAVVAHLTPIAAGLDVEKFWVLCLNRRNRLIRRIEVTSGIATASLAHPREVFREAIRENAVSILCAHNHPSGDPSPSAADIRTTRQLREAATALDIPLLDHIILGQPHTDPTGQGYYSFKNTGIL